jgi:hypothetical protein
MDNNWNELVEEVILDIQKRSSSNSHLHLKLANGYLFKYNFLTMLGIIIGPMSAAIASLNEQQCSYEYKFLHMCMIILSMSSGIIMSVIKFGKYDEKCNKNKLAATNYITIEHNIRQQLMLQKEDRLNSNTYLEWLQQKFDNIFSNSPLLPHVKDDTEIDVKNEETIVKPEIDKMLQYEFERLQKK